MLEIGSAESSRVVWMGWFLTERCRFCGMGYVGGECFTVPAFDGALEYWNGEE